MDHKFSVIALPQPILEFIRYAIVGVVATSLHYGIYYALQFQIETNLSYTIGYAIAFVANFFMSSYFTFGVRPTVSKGFAMALAHGFNYLLHMVLLNVFLSMQIDPKLAPIPVFAIAIPVNFLVIRFVFNYNSK